MSKSNKILYSVLGSVVILIVLNILFAGTGHVKVVESNVTLTESNNKLTQENQKLTTENQELKVMTDSLIVAGDSLKNEVSSLENKVDNYETQIEQVNNVNRSNDNYSKPYKIVVPITEISDSTN